MLAMYFKGFLVACGGIPVTVGVSLISVVIGGLFGLLLALMRLSKNKLVMWISKIFTDVVRGTPLVVQAFIMAYGVPQLLHASNIDFKWPVLVLPAIIVCGLNSAAYMSEVIRGGIQAVDKGQMEAARSLGMSHRQAMRLVIIPQAIKIILPAIGNEFITLIKETSVLSFVGVVEVMRKGTLWNAATYMTFPAYIGVALAYMLLTIPLSKLVGKMERKMAAEGKNDDGTAEDPEKEAIA